MKNDATPALVVEQSQQRQGHLTNQNRLRKRQVISSTAEKNEKKRKCEKVIKT